MAEFFISDRSGKRIVDWRTWTRPKRDYQWRAGRSAMELARAWFTAARPQCPSEVADLLAHHPETNGIQLVEGIPEYVTSLPEPGEGRNHDLLLLGNGPHGPAVVAIEAKVDESFGETIGDCYRTGRASTKPTRLPERIDALIALAFGPESRADKAPWGGLRYQLLTALTGTAIEASRRKASTAVMIVHEFRTESVDAVKAAANEHDFRNFIHVLLGLPADQIASGRIYGPATVGPGPLIDSAVGVLIGKVIFNWQQAIQSSEEGRTSDAPYEGEVP